MAATVHGLEMGKDVILKNMPIGEQLALPKGIDAVVPWDAGASVILEERKNGRMINSDLPVQHVRRELRRLDGTCRQRTRCRSGAQRCLRRVAALDASECRGNGQASAEDPSLKNFSKEILTQQTRTYNLLYKPTFIYPHAKFWGEANEPIFIWLFQQKRIQRPLKGTDFEQSVDARFMEKTFGKLGWASSEDTAFPAGKLAGLIGQDALPGLHDAHQSQGAARSSRTRAT